MWREGSDKISLVPLDSCAYVGRINNPICEICINLPSKSSASTANDNTACLCRCVYASELAYKKDFRILNNELRRSAVFIAIFSWRKYTKKSNSDLQIRMRKWHITWFLNNKHLSWVLKRTVSPFRWDGSFEHPKHMFELESHSKHPLILSASCKKLETWQLPVSRADVNIYIMYMRGTSHVSGSPVLLFFCWWYSLLESQWICGSNEFSNYGYVSVDIRKKRKVWFKYRDIYCSCTDPERFVRGGPTLTKVF